MKAGSLRSGERLSQYNQNNTKSSLSGDDCKQFASLSYVGEASTYRQIESLLRFHAGNHPARISEGMGSLAAPFPGLESRYRLTLPP